MTMQVTMEKVLLLSVIMTSMRIDELLCQCHIAM